MVLWNVQQEYLACHQSRASTRRKWRSDWGLRLPGKGEGGWWVFSLSEQTCEGPGAREPSGRWSLKGRVCPEGSAGCELSPRGLLEPALEESHRPGKDLGLSPKGRRSIFKVFKKWRHTIRLALLKVHPCSSMEVGRGTSGQSGRLWGWKKSEERSGGSPVG